MARTAAGSAIPSDLADVIGRLALSLELPVGAGAIFDNCGTLVTGAPWAYDLDRVVVERDGAMLEHVVTDRRATIAVGSTATSAYTESSCLLAIATTTEHDAPVTFARLARALAPGGVAVVAMPSVLLDGQGEHAPDMSRASAGTSLVAHATMPSSGEATSPLTTVVVVQRHAAGNWYQDLSAAPQEPARGRADALGILQQGLEMTLPQVRSRLAASPAPTARPTVVASLPDSELAEYRVDSRGGVWRAYADGTADPVARAYGQRAARLAGAIALASSLDAILEYEASPEATEAGVETRLAELRADHAAYVEAHGSLVDNGAVAELGTMTRMSHLAAQLEDVDPQGAYAGPALVLRERVAWPPRGYPTHVDGADEALSISLEQTGSVDTGLIASLLRVGEADAIAALGERVVADVDNPGRWLCAEDYLTGNVGAKLDHVRELIDEQAEAGWRQALRAWREGQGLTRGVRGMRQATLDFRQTDEYALLTGRNADISMDVEAAIRTISVGRMGRPAALGELLRAAAADAREGAWDPVASPDAAAAARHLAQYGRYADPLQALVDVALSPAVTPEVLTLVVRAMPYQLREAIMRLARPGYEGRPPGMRANEYHAEVALECLDQPEVLEWLVACGGTMSTRGAGDEGIETWSEYRMGVDTLGPAWARASTDAGGFADFKARRAAALAVEVNETRLAELREVERRLVAALPRRLERKDIAARLGSPWVPASVYRQFALEHMSADPRYLTLTQRKALVVVKDHELGSWDLRYADSIASEAAKAAYGIEPQDLGGDVRVNGASAFRLLANAMRGTATVITRSLPDGDHTRVVTDEELTLLAADKRADLEQAFDQWLWADPVRAARLVEIYNERMNRTVARRFDGSYLTLPDASEAITLQAHQKDAVARVLRSQEGTLLAHAVGAGKTFEGIVSVHEARRLGKCEKPLVAVPNSVVGQWAREWARVYPRDRVLVMDPPAQRSPEARQRFWEAARSGQWDAVVVPHSQFDTLALSPEARRRALTARQADLARWVEGVPDGGPATTQRRRQATYRQELKAIARALDQLEGDQGPRFDTIGFDMLVVDEAHRYKHLGVRTNKSVAGIDTKSSRMAENLLALCDHLRDQGKGSNIVFLTGTPVTNSVCELFVMQRYLAPQALRELGLESFDAWSDTFGQVVREVEIKPEGGLQTKDRFSRFTNLPELMGLVHGFCDLVTNDDLSLELPDVRVVNVEVPMTAEQRLCMRWLEGRGDAIRHNKVSQSVDNMLLITGDGKKVALDPKLLFPDDEAVGPMVGGKVDACVANVVDVYERTTITPDGAEALGVQLVFCDTSTAASGRGWNVQDDLRRRLVEAGIPEGEVATVPGSLSPTRRERLFEQARRGQVRVLIGSTQTLGTGVSVQRRLAAIHDLDCPWRASDLEQRMGRIMRQGNMFATLDWWRPLDFRYATVGTFDAYLYQTTARKGAFVSQVMTNDSPLREASELSDTVLTLSEMKALASGNPAVRRRLELENEVKGLQLKRSAWSREMESARSRLEHEVLPEVRELERELEGADELLAAVRGVLAAKGDKREGDLYWADVTVDGVAYAPTREGVAAANVAISERASRVTVGTDVAELARIGEIQVGVEWRQPDASALPTPRLAITCADGCTLSSALSIRTANAALPHVGGPVAQAFELIQDGEATMRRRLRTLARRRGEAQELTERVTDQRWPLEGELARRRSELEALPVDESEALSAAQAWPHLSDVYAAISNAPAEARGTQEERAVMAEPRLEPRRRGVRM